MQGTKEYAAFIAEATESFQPQSDKERQLAVAVAEDQWRLKRVRAIEEHLFARQGQAEDPGAVAFRQARNYMNASREFALLSLYESRINGHMHKKLAELDRLQRERTLARERAFKEAVRDAEIADSQGLHYRPVQDGFGFSTVEITRQMYRDRQLKRARAFLAERKKQPPEP